MRPSTLNKNNSAVKRIMQEARELANDPCTDYSAAPLEDDIFEWHCTLRGSAGTEFEGGLYHFRILLPAEYPFRPPSIMMLTPNGRFELNAKICISFTSYHEELWQPAWGVRTAIIGLQGFFPLKGQAAVGIGSIEYPSTERKRLAALSREWVCPHCEQTNLELLPDPPAEATSSSSTVASLESAPSENPHPAEPPMDNFAIDLPSSTPTSERITPPPSRFEPEEDATTVPASEPVLASGSRDSADTVTDLSASASTLTRPPPHVAVEAPAAHPARTSLQKPPLLLDSAICVLLVVLFAIICRRMV